jgi:4-amino-4-deoxy-L-arabinose transferase-like glycosyltransferase
MALPGGDWFTPHLNGFPHFQKPPLLYWCTAISVKVFGAHPWAARLPVVLAAFGTLAIASWLARTLFGHGLHRTTVLVLSSCVGFYWLARVLTPDMMLTFGSPPRSLAPSGGNSAEVKSGAWLSS